MKVTRKISDNAVLSEGLSAHQHIQDTRWFLEDTAAKLVRTWHNLHPERLSEMLTNKQQAPYNAHTYDATLFILTPREAYTLALACVGIRGAAVEGKTTEQLQALAEEHSEYVVGLLTKYAP
jgi:hypothetical protein